MSAAEADAFTPTRSRTRSNMSHPEPGARGIKAEGFRLDVSEATGRVWGDGTYLAIDRDTTNFYSAHTPGSTTLKVKVDVKKVLDFDATGLTPGENAVREIAASGLKKYPEFKEIVKKIEATTRPC